VSAPNLTNAVNASLASTTTTTINATNFTNAGLVNGATTNVTVGGGLNNTGGSLMAVNSLSINAGSLNNQSGIIFAGNPNTPNGPITGDVSLTINGGDGSFNNASGQLLAQRNMGISATNMAFDPSQGTISQGGQLSITVALINNTGTWNYGGQGVMLTGLNGINNYGTMTGTAPLTLSTNGTFTNFGQVTGSDVTFNGTLNNVAGAVMHADGTLALNGNTTNRGTVEAGSVLSVTGGNYDNQGATTRSQGDANFNIGGTLTNTGGSIFAGNNVNINAGAVVNDQTAPGAPVVTTAQTTDPALLWSAVAGTETVWSEHHVGTGDGGMTAVGSSTSTATLGDLLSPQGRASQSQPVAGAGTVTFYEHDGQWSVGTGPDPTATSSVTLTLPTINETSVTQQPGTSGVISAGNAISLTANSLSNQGGQIAAQGNITLNVQSLSNGSASPTTTYQTGLSVDQGQLSSFFAQLKALGTITVAGSGNPTGTVCDSQDYCTVGDVIPPTQFNISPGAAPTATGSTVVSLPTGMIAAGNNLAVYGGNLVNAGLLYAGNNVQVGAASLTNQGGNQQNYSTQTGCAAGVPSTACGTAGNPRGANPTTTTFGYDQNDATIYAGHDLVIAAGQINNTYGNLLAGHDIVIGGVGSTASSTTPASSLNNTSGNIVAGNNITLNVSGAITNNLPPPVPVHENYGMQEQYSGCMTAGGYKESYCEGYVDQQSGSSSVISAGNNLQINAGSLTNIGSLIAAGNTATIAVAGPVVNEAQTLNAYWHSHWVQETGIFSSDKRHDVWACGSPAECTALYGSAYTSAGGTIDPPQPVGNIAATIQAPNLSITSGGQIQNVGNVVGTSVTLTGQKLINGITTANTYTPRVNAPSQVISLSPVTLPGLNLSAPRAVGGALPTPVAGKASFVDNSLGGSAIGSLGPQDLLSALPSSLQPSSALFYYNPQEEDLMLQQAALQQTGKASFIDGLTYDSKSGMSVTEQEKRYLYQNALDYATTNNLQLGAALTQTQISALDKPMLWYVEQTVPDPSCSATGVAACPTITALMPQVYLPSDTSAMSAGGNITGTDVTLNFGKDSGGSVLNTGSITASDTLTVNTGTLTNQANQVNVGEIWGYVKDAGYSKTTGTEVQPGGFMSAANMDLNVQTLGQIGGALQKLNADGAVDSAGTQQLLANLQQQLGVAFTQTAVHDDIHTDFIAQGGGVPTVVVAAIAIAASVVTGGAALATLGPVLSGALAGMVGAFASQAFSGNGLNLVALAEAGVVGGLTAGALNEIDPSGQSLQTITSAIGKGTASASQIAQGLELIAERSVVTAGIDTAVYGGSFGSALEYSAISDAGAVGAGAIGTLSQNGPLWMAPGSAGNLLAHAGLGCALSAAEGTGCAGGAIGGAASALVASYLVEQAGGVTNLTNDQRALIVGASTLLGGLTAGLAGQNAQGGATAAANEALNNSTGDHRTEEEKAQDAIKAQQQKEAAILGQGRTVKTENGETYVTGSSAIGGLGGATNSGATAGSAADMTTAAQLRTQLSLQQAGILDSNGQLTAQAIKSSDAIPLADGVIKNPTVVSELTSDGSNIADWGKYTTQSATMPNGQSMQVHYYMNSVTGKVDYVTPDFKVKGVVKP
jgi:filamentous hemagglutinin